jgi:hypothetical protein
MLPNSDTLALGTGAGTLMLGMVIGVATVTMAVLAYRQSVRLFNWYRHTHRVAQNAQDLQEVGEPLQDALRELCHNTHKPCTQDDFGNLRTQRNLINTAAEDLETIGGELRDVVESLDGYLGSALSTRTAGSRTAQMEAAMRQEDARQKAQKAIKAAQQRIRTLRKT